MGNIPLIDLEIGGDGLYPNRSNQMPGDYLEWGIQIANSITRVDGNGNPDPTGRMIWGFLNGMSNFNKETRSAIDSFHLSYGYPKRITPFNGCRGSWSLDRIVNDPNGFWHSDRGGVYTRFVRRGFHPMQMQVAIMKNSIRGLDLNKDGSANAVESQWDRAIETTLDLFPNIKLILMSGAMWTGYNTKQLPRKEPQAFYESYGVKQLIERRINAFRAGDTTSPFVAWLWYSWADGANPRSDGLKWLPGDYASDMVHPGPGALQKWSNGMMKSLETSPVTKPWFLP